MIIVGNDTAKVATGCVSAHIYNMKDCCSWLPFLCFLTFPPSHDSNKITPRDFGQNERTEMAIFWGQKSDFKRA